MLDREEEEECLRELRKLLGLQVHNCAALPFKSMIYFPGLFELNALIAASEGVEE